MASDYRIVWDAAALDEVFRSPRGPVAKDLTRRAIRVRNAAVRGAPVDTGRLRSSITYEIGSEGDVIVARIGSNVHYSKWVEMGTSRMRAQPYLRPALRAGAR